MESRVAEQSLISYCKTLKKTDKMFNQINGMRKSSYEEALSFVSIPFDETEIKIIGEECWIDPLIYPEVK